jgi:hypothetical protein
MNLSQKTFEMCLIAMLYNKFNINLPSYSISEFHLTFKSLHFLSDFKYEVTYVFKEKPSTGISNLQKRNFPMLAYSFLAFIISSSACNFSTSLNNVFSVFQLSVKHISV